MRITRLLIANRGEIAVRVAQAADMLGIETVGVSTRDDADAGHVFKVGQAVELAGSGVAGYLDGKDLLRLAVAHGCDAVHPGYGFLAENAAFARDCQAAGLTWIGPDPDVLELFGDKAAARAHVEALGVPVLAATPAPTSLADARAFLAGLGPGAAVMVKAVAGGGGRGIRAVTNPDDLERALERCQSEARAAFGDGRVYVEQRLSPARHIEVQIIGDGSTVTHVWDRDCSAQRRQQKLVEVAPAGGLPAPLRARILDAAVAIGRSVGYRGLGTVEFLVAGDTFAFIETNPRVQVEHTVTEEVTGVDLVQAQLRTLGGTSLAELGLAEPPPEPTAVAIQARVNAEAWQADGSLAPGIGVLTTFAPPGGRGIRVETHAYPGLTVTGRYDSLLAKVIATDPGGDLSLAARRLRRGLQEFAISGVPTTIPMLQAILADETFLHDRLMVTTVDERWSELLAITEPAALTPPAAPTGLESAGLGSRLGAVDVPPELVAVTAGILGVVVEVAVGPEDLIAAGSTVVVLEAMKMEHAVTAALPGVVERVLVAAGDVVPAGGVVALLAPAETGDAVTGGETVVDPSVPRPDLRESMARHRLGLDEARPEHVARRHASGHRTARENIADLCDPDSFQEYGALMIASQRRRREIEDLIRNTPADGMVAGIGTIDGQRCVVMSYDYMVLAGTQGLQNHKKTDRLIAIAERHRLPLVIFAEGGGGRPGDTDGFAVASLDIPTFGAFARLSGVVPLIAIVSGYCFAGNAALAACCDVIIATADANLGMGGPPMIRAGGLGDIAARDVGPMSLQEPNGVVDLVVADEAAAVRAARQYLSYFTTAQQEWSAADQLPLREAIPRNRRRAYDIRPIIASVADEGSVLELRPNFGVGIITVLARVEGRPVGIVANNPRHLGGAIDADAADKASRFLQLCDVFALPIVSLCDTPGFMVGNDAERTATVRHFGRLFVIGPNLRVPVCMVILRKAYGLAPVAMSGGGLKGPALTVAWPTGEFGGMALEGAVELAYRRDLEAIADPVARQTRYAELLQQMYDSGNAVSAATAFEIDDVIDPAETRRVIAATLASVALPERGVRAPYVDAW
jgi:acetyl/propionyl-CoA carboxylase alpha subunit